MTLQLWDLEWLAGLACVALTAGGSGCSSSSDAQQSTPRAGSSSLGKAGTSSSLGGSSGTGSGGAGAGGSSGSGVGGAATATALPWLHTDGNALKDPSGNTVILRGIAMIDLGTTEVSEGGVKNMIDRLTKLDDPQGSSPGWATRVVRLMVGPKDGDSHSPIQYEPGGDYYDRVLRPAVDYAREKGLYAIIDWHYIDTTSLHAESTNVFWAEMAPHFAADSHVLFELFNEPTNAGNWASVKTDMQAWYDTVRASAPNNLVLVGTANWCQLPADAARDPLTGTNIMYVDHMYPQHQSQAVLRMQLVNAAALVPIFMTEWGFRDDPMNDITNGTITSYGAPLKQLVEEQRISWTAWCASATWGPPMFNADTTLRVGEGEMGGFVKDWLYEKRDADLPQP